MIYYYYKPDNESEQDCIYIDFNTLYAQVKSNYTVSSLYRLLHKRCETIRYQNRDLYPLSEIMKISEVYEAMKRDE